MFVDMDADTTNQPTPNSNFLVRSIGSSPHPPMTGNLQDGWITLVYGVELRTVVPTQGQFFISDASKPQSSSYLA
ncbi:hypothetical protein EYC84_004377 [Monilinia fructicola]|uniref:Uncharacterized protein n=1 Tax=Monilinia fructicola TaxID=38448 RepID=A0A5M9K401_MONFR|nr:hypothetical protein EYC84_004377 [Monilinia fructicola]